MNINQYIDYTILKPGCLPQQIKDLCATAVQHTFCAVCVPPMYVSLAKEELTNTNVKVCSVIGFPHGMHIHTTKIAETEQLIAKGAQELDMVANISLLKSNKINELHQEIQEFRDLCYTNGVISKIIIESGLLNFEEVKTICEICSDIAVDFVKTSTGFADIGAELDKVRLMREILPANIQIKASGGIRDYKAAVSYIEAGATRIGTSRIIIA